VSGIDQHDIALAVALGRHPEDDVELGVPGASERMRAVEVDGLSSEDADAAAFGLGQLRNNSRRG